MTGQRWWHVFFTATIVVLAGIATVGYAPHPWSRGVAWATLAVMTAAYVSIGRRALRDETRALPFAIVLIVGSGVLVACSPSLAVVQAITFPLLWSITESKRLAIIANVALAVSVAGGFLVAEGLGRDSVTQAIAIQSISLVGSLALGIWITRIAELSHERQRLLDELTASQSQVAALSRDSGIVSERERLAREIHDTIAQDLTGLVMLTQRARRELASDTASDATLELLEQSARSVLAETRGLVAGGAAMGVEHGGIRDALGRLAERFSRETGVTVGVEAADGPALDRDTEVVLLRIAQEGLANVRKHANAESAALTLGFDAGTATLTVSDDGEGFDATSRPGGFGLDGMRDRLALVGGTLHISTQPHSGTTLVATLPLGGPS